MASTRGIRFTSARTAPFDTHLCDFTYRQFRLCITWHFRRASVAVLLGKRYPDVVFSENRKD